jgi:hypothetical protein
MADTEIFIGIIVMFIAIGALLPFIQDAFSQDVQDYDLEGLSDSVGEDPGNVSVLEIFGSIGLMFFWTFGSIPVLLDLLLFLPLRVVMVYLGIRMLRGV